MKNLFKPTLIAVALALSTNTVLASGVPTVDAAGIATTIAENLKTLEQLKEQLEAANRQIEQAKQFANETKNRLEGNWKLSDIISNDQFLNALPKDAKDILTSGMSIAGLRNKYGLKTENSGLQQQFDRLMAYRERTERNYNNTIKRIDSLKQIKVLNDAATTPAQKADVANKLALLQLEFSQEQSALKQAEEQFQAQERLENEASFKAFQDTLKQKREEYKQKFAK